MTMTEPHLTDQLRRKRGFLQDYLRTPPEIKPRLVPQVRKVWKDIGSIKKELKYRESFTDKIPEGIPERDVVAAEEVVVPEVMVSPVAEEKKSAVVPLAIGAGLLVKLLFF